MIGGVEIGKAGMLGACLAAILVTGLPREAWMSSRVRAERTSTYIHLMAIKVVGQTSPPAAEGAQVERLQPILDTYLGKLQPVLAKAIARRWPAPTKSFPLRAYSPDDPLQFASDPLEGLAQGPVRYQMRFFPLAISGADLYVEVCFSEPPPTSSRAALEKEVQRVIAKLEP